MAELTAAQRAKLQAAADLIADRLQRGDTPAGVIAKLQGAFGATYRTAPTTNHLRCAGVAATCTWSRDVGLLDAWRRLATLKLAEPAGGYGSDR